MKTLILCFIAAAAALSQVAPPKPQPAPSAAQQTTSAPPASVPATGVASPVAAQPRTLTPRERVQPPSKPVIDLDLQMELIFAENEMLGARQQADQEVKDAQKRGDANIAVKQAALEEVFRRAQRVCGTGLQPIKQQGVTDGATKGVKGRVVCEFGGPGR